jgi:nucleotide-binding universal stress UspA family protein
VQLAYDSPAGFRDRVESRWSGNIDLIVISTHGRTGLAHMLIGSVAETVVRTSPCPVLTVRPKGHQFVMP